MRDLPIGEMVETGSPNGRSSGPMHFIFLFHATAEQIADLSVDYTNSESAKHADCVRRLKKAIRSTRVREG